MLFLKSLTFFAQAEMPADSGVDSSTMVYKLIGDSTYFILAALALWGLYQIVIVLTRVAQKRFKSEELQDQFMDDVEQMLIAGDFEGVHEYCDGDKRAIPQMIDMAITNREHGFKRAKQVMLDRFSRDVMSDIEYRLSWVSTMIKTAPMVGLFGTVFGMMGAFKTLATAVTVEPSLLAGDIQVALVTTAAGLAIAIPLMLLVAQVNIRISQMEDLVGSGLTRFYDAFRVGLSRAPVARPAAKAQAEEEVVYAEAVS